MKMKVHFFIFYFCIMIFIFSMRADLQCSVHFLLYSKVTQSHIHVYILFLTLSCSITSDQIQFPVLYSRISLSIHSFVQPSIYTPTYFFFILMIFIFSLIAGLQCSVSFLLHSRVTQPHIHIHSFFSHYHVPS